MNEEQEQQSAGHETAGKNGTVAEHGRGLHEFTEGLKPRLAGGRRAHPGPDVRPDPVPQVCRGFDLTDRGECCPERRVFRVESAGRRVATERTGKLPVFGGREITVHVPVYQLTKLFSCHSAVPLSSSK